MTRKILASLLGVVILSLPACGNKVLQSHALLYVPSASTEVVRVNNPYQWDSTKKANALAIVKSAGGAAGFSSLDKWLDSRSLLQTKDGSKLNFSTDVKPWLGAKIVLSDLPKSSGA